MKKWLMVIVIVVVFVSLVSIFSKKDSNSKTGGISNQEQTTEENSKAKNDNLEDICNYFPKELVEKAIGRPIVKVENGTLTDPTCNYYTSYSETYDHTPYGDKPGGSHIVVVYDTKDFAKDRISNEKSGTKYEADPSIKMNNFVMKNNTGKIWQVALDYGDEKYIRIKSIDDAVTGEELVKIAMEFASK